MVQWLKVIFIIIVLVIVYELVLTYTRFIRRKRIFNIAVDKSKEINKPLMVIGDPDNGSTNYLVGRSYECGDICIDITGCPGCKIGIRQKIEEYLPRLQSNSYVIFISCVLEYVDSDKIDFIISEIKRVSGGNYFVVSVEPLSMTALFYPTRFITGEGCPNQVILSEYPDKNIRYKKL